MSEDGHSFRHTEVEAVEDHEAGDIRRQLITAPSSRPSRAWRTIIVAALVMGCIGTALGPFLLARAESERQERVSAAASIQLYFCRQNNQQDKALGDLVAISVDNSPPPGQLTPAEQSALAIFQARLADLNDPRECKQLAYAYADGVGVDRQDVHFTPLGHAAEGSKGKP